MEWPTGRVEFPTRALVVGGSGAGVPRRGELRHAQVLDNDLGAEGD
jgi:hypothetical protein